MIKFYNIITLVFPKLSLKGEGQGASDTVVQYQEHKDTNTDGQRLWKSLPTPVSRREARDYFRDL